MRKQILFILFCGCLSLPSVSQTLAPDELYIIPGYLRFVDKKFQFGTAGVSAGYTKTISRSVGLTLDAGYYTHTKKETDLNVNTGIINIAAGVTYLPGGVENITKGLTLSTHALAGVSVYIQNAKAAHLGNYYNDAAGFHFDVGAALDLELNRQFNIRLLQADYAPTFFFKNMQQNYRLSAGVVYNIVKRRS